MKKINLEKFELIKIERDIFGEIIKIYFKYDNNEFYLRYKKNFDEEGEEIYTPTLAIYKRMEDEPSIIVVESGVDVKLEFFEQEELEVTEYDKEQFVKQLNYVFDDLELV